MDRRSFIAAIVAGVSALPVLRARADMMSDAEALVAKYSARQTQWHGPTTGPKAARNKRIVVLAADMKNGGVLGVTDGVREATEKIGWSVRVFDGGGWVNGRAAAFRRALALKPDGLIINGFDATEQKVHMAEAKAAKIAVVGWHALPKIGPDPADDVFANVSTDPMLVSEAAADWAYVDAKGKPRVIIFTDTTYDIAVAKAKRMKEQIQKLGGTVLQYVDTPIASASKWMPTLTTALLQRYGAKWTHSLAINDIYFDFMGPSLAAAGIPGNGNPKAVAAGDGSASAYQRIRAGQYQSATVAEPLNLQGWQLIDELNRAMQGKPWSGYVSPMHMVTKANIAYDGGKQNRFDPDNGYRDVYAKIWGI